jgi:hypothetical protein
LEPLGPLRRGLSRKLATQIDVTKTDSGRRRRGGAFADQCALMGPSCAAPHGRNWDVEHPHWKRGRIAGLQSFVVDLDDIRDGQLIPACGEMLLAVDVVKVRGLEASVLQHRGRHAGVLGRKLGNEGGGRVAEQMW